MEYLPNTETLIHLLDQYGIIILFVLLALGIIALPVPEETLLVLTGILISNEKLALAPAFFAVLLGSICGITVSYLLGRTAGVLYHTQIRGLDRNYRKTTRTSPSLV